MKAIVKTYFEEHGFTAALAKRYGVVVSGSTVHYECFDGKGRFYRTRDLDAERKATKQPKRRKLDVCYFHPPPTARPETTDLLLCEGEPDALAALQARREPGTSFATTALLRLKVAFLPGTATPARKVIDEIRRLRPRAVYLAFDGDHAGDAAAERILDNAAHRLEAPVPMRLPIPRGRDLADVLAFTRRHDLPGGDALGVLIRGAA